jgi:hypothetical protein
LFNPFDDDDNEYLDAFVQILGKLPEPWWSTTWEDRRRVYKDEVDEQGFAVAAGAQPESSGQEKTERTIHPSVAAYARSLKDKIAPGVWYMSTRRSVADRHRDISHTEQSVFADLFGRLLEYQPDARISAKDSMGQEWFRL